MMASTTGFLMPPELPPRTSAEAEPKKLRNSVPGGGKKFKPPTHKSKS